MADPVEDHATVAIRVEEIGLREVEHDRRMQLDLEEPVAHERQLDDDALECRLEAGQVEDQSPIE